MAGRRTAVGKKMNYSKKKLIKALNAIKSGKFKICEAAKIFQIPRQTLADKIKGRRPFGYCRPGPQAVLGTDVESTLENWLLENHKFGFPLNRESLEFSVKHLVEQIPEIARRSIPFKNNTPGKGWFKSFQRRHPQLMKQSCEKSLDNKSVLITDDLKTWHDNIESLLKEKNCSNLLQDSNRIWVMNEFVVAVNQDNSLTSLQRKASQKLASKLYSDNTYAFFLTANAVGKLAPPLIITKNSEIFVDLAEMVSGRWGVLLSESCLLTSESFYEYISSILYPYLVEINTVFPIVIFINDDFFCTSLPLTEFCRNSNIILLGIPRNASKFLNPLSAANGFPLEMLRKENCMRVRYDSAIQHPAISLVENLLTDVTIEKYIVDKFQSCGIYPFVYIEESMSSEQVSAVSIQNKEQFMLADCFGSKIPPDIVDKFENCKSKNIPWNGPKKYLALYEFWLTAHKYSTYPSRDDAKNTNGKLQSSENLDDFIVEEEIVIY